MCELGDYFSRMGGAARPRNMRESEIHLYIACQLLENHNSKFNSTKYLNPDFVEAAMPVIENTNTYLSKVSLSPSEILPFATEIYQYADNKLGDAQKSSRWEEFGDYLREGKQMS